MCYISPFRNTPLAVFKQVTEFLQKYLGEYIGRIIVNMIYIGVVPIGGFIIYLVSYYIKKALTKKQKAGN